MNNTLHIICTVYGRALNLRVLIGSILLQTDPRWRLYIVHDGPAGEDIMAVIREAQDPRIKFECTNSVNGYWGHPNRKIMLSKIPFNRKDFVLITNDDNYYVPTFVEVMLQHTGKAANLIGLVYCNTLHSYLQYDVLKTALKRKFIDMGSFIVRVDVARKVGFNAVEEFEADGIYAEACAEYCHRFRLRSIYVQKTLFVHN